MRYGMTRDGRLTVCKAKPEDVGKGSCNHISHQQENESVIEFIERATREIKAEKLKNSETEVRNIKDIQFVTDSFKEKIASMTTAERLNKYAYLRGFAKALKAYIQKNDENQAVFTRKECESYAEDEFQAKMNNYRDAKDAFDTMVYQYECDHPEYYNKTRRIIIMEPNWFANRLIEKNINSLASLDEAVYDYFEASKQRDYIKSEYLDTNDDLKTSVSCVKPEYKDVVAAAKEKMMEETGWPGESALKELCSRVKITRYTQKRSIEIRVAK